jgi:hypothetical protein
MNLVYLNHEARNCMEIARNCKEMQEIARRCKKLQGDEARNWLPTVAVDAEKR